MTIICITAAVITAIIAATIITCNISKNNADIVKNESNTITIEIRKDLLTIHDLTENVLNTYNMYEAAPKEEKGKYIVTHDDVQKLLNNIHDICDEYLCD